MLWRLIGQECFRPEPMPSQSTESVTFVDLLDEQRAEDIQTHVSSHVSFDTLQIPDWHYGFSIFLDFVFVH